jgi:hypothetical protein
LRPELSCADAGDAENRPASQNTIGKIKQRDLEVLRTPFDVYTLVSSQCPKFDLAGFSYHIGSIFSLTGELELDYSAEKINL